MNRRLRLLAMAALVGTALWAQECPLHLYDDMNEDLQRIFCDYARTECDLVYISTQEGQYVGQALDGALCGWGYFLATDGRQIVGQFRGGSCFFGITLGDATARVGGKERYTLYDLATGKISRVVSPLEEVALSPRQQQAYEFKKVVYKNGDCYYGELLNGKRHGYGLYYWSNGDFWFGRYADGYRQGFGALFKSDNHVYFGKWVADDKVE